MKKTFKTFILSLAMASLFTVGAYASAEPSAEPSEEPAAQASQEMAEQTSKTTIIYGGQTYVLDVYEIDGVKYVKLADAQELLADNGMDDLTASQEAAAASGEASGEMAGETSGEPSGEPMDSDDGLASGEPSGEPSGEMAGEASGEPSGEPMDGDDGLASGEPTEEPAAQSEQAGFDVTFRINGEEFETAAVGLAVDGNTYTFQISELLETLGLSLEYDEETDMAYLAAQPDGLMAALLLGQTASTDAAAEEPVAEPAEEPAAEESAEEAPAPVEEEPAEETASEQTDGVPATDGTENQQNVLESTDQPETEEQFDAYTAYLTQFMNDYTGQGDGTFDDGARDMALGELSSVRFGDDVNAFPFEMFVSQFGALDYSGFLQAGA